LLVVHDQKDDNADDDPCMLIFQHTAFTLHMQPDTQTVGEGAQHSTAQHSTAQLQSSAGVRWLLVQLWTCSSAGITLGGRQVEPQACKE
jgi:hypothetical protein